jgi:hypothetical protein
MRATISRIIGIDADEALPAGLRSMPSTRAEQRQPDPRPLLARRLAGAERPGRRPHGKLRRDRRRPATTRPAP